MSTAHHRTAVYSRRWTKDEYHRLGELGFFQGQRVELIEGRLMVQSPQNPSHATALLQVAGLLQQHFVRGHHVRPQLPLDLGAASEPEPDVAVVAGTIAQYRTAHPTSAVLIVEVSDTTLSYDRRRKGSLYARAGIADYWIVNLPRQRLEVYRGPVPDPRRPYGHRYSSRIDLAAPATVSPLALPQAVLPVADLLP
jgi:Uma2 family endonuclease